MDCPVCFDGTDAPRSLPCGHLLCLECLQRLYDRTSIRCPTCRQAHPIRPEACLRIYLPALPDPSVSNIAKGVAKPGAGAARDWSFRSGTAAELRSAEEENRRARQIQEETDYQWALQLQAEEERGEERGVPAEEEQIHQAASARTSRRHRPSTPRPDVLRRRDSSPGEEPHSEQLPAHSHQARDVCSGALAQARQRLGIVDQVQATASTASMSALSTPPRSLRSSPPRIALTVKIVTGQQLSLVVEASDTILNLKEQIQAHEGLSPDHQRLIQNGRALEEHYTIGYYNIANGDIIHVCIRMAGD